MLLAAGCGTGHAATTSTARLIGLFRLAPGDCTTPHAKPTGSYLIVLSASADRAVRNPAGGCANPDYTPLRPGTAGGLTTGRFQPLPAPAFDAHRNSLASAVIKPVRFGPYTLGVGTDPHDEQGAPSGAPAYPAPVALATGATLDIDLRSLVLTYAGRSGSTCASSYGLGCWELGSKSATGSYDAATRRFVVDWFSGESFSPKGDSIEVHLEGTFVTQSS
jgi:hypothetical protein